MKPSDKEFSEMSRLVQLVHIAKNPHIYGYFPQSYEDKDGLHQRYDIDPLEQGAIVATLEEAQLPFIRK